MSTSPYQEAASFVQEVWKKRCSVKKVLYDRNGAMKCSKATYACVCNVIKQEKLLKEVLERCSFPRNSIKNEALLYVLLHELLLGVHHDIRGGGGIKRIVIKHKKALQEALAEIQSNSENVNVCFPRYARINTLQSDLKSVSARLRELDVEHFLDRHVPDLLVLPRSATKVVLGDKILSKALILQDKSSCFSALCLVHGFGRSIPSNATILDACAAPGNKTSHALMLYDGPVLAFDRSKERLKSLQQRLGNILPKNRDIQTQHADFLQQTIPTDVRAILLDPSCSGSGIYTSVDRHGDQDDASDRIEKLANFQFTMLHHALQAPHVERVVYSTCSIHMQENEQVVSQILEKCSEEWRLVSPRCLSAWSRRGVACPGLEAEDQARLIRASQDDETNGFFVACFERKESSVGVKHKYEAPSTAHGVALYDGQFANASPAKMQFKNIQDKTDAPRPQKAKPLTTHGKNARSTVLPNKVLKKRAWKERQKLAKRQRLQGQVNKK